MQNYSFSVLWSDEDGEYVATSAEFPGLSGLGATPEEAIAELKDAIEVAVQAYLEDGEPVPSARHLKGRGVMRGLIGRLFRRRPKEETTPRPDLDHDAVRDAVAMLAFETGDMVFATVHDDGSIEIRTHPTDRSDSDDEG